MPSPLSISDDELPRAIAPWITSARWFAGKGLTNLRLRLHDLAIVEGGPLALTLVDVQADTAAADGVFEPLRYAVPLGVVGGAASTPPAVRDASHSPAFADWLVRTMLAGGVAVGRRGEFRGHAVGGVAAPPVGPPTAVTPIGGDASNTSLIVRWSDRTVVVKLIRRCRDGVQPEVEIGSLLAGVAGWRESPRLLGWLEHVEPSSTGGAPASTAIATVHACVPGGESAWDRLVSLLGSTGQGGRCGPDALRLAAAIGGATARLHAALAAGGDAPAFAPRSMTPTARREAATRMADHATSVFSRAAARLHGLPAPIADRLRTLLAAADRLVARLRDPAGLETSASLIRVHGDYHLGQVLVGDGGPSGATGDHIFIIDFEGEPGRSLAERRAPTSVFKDVAGMCRSFDYLLRHVGVSSRASELDRLERAFLDAYATAAAGQPWWPADPGEATRLLGVYKLDKAVYELAYELDNRPDWIGVPLAALEDCAS